MNTRLQQQINDRQAQTVLEQLREELDFFMSYMGETVRQLLLGNISRESFDQRYFYAKEGVKVYSESIDESYQRGDFGRLGIMDGGPNYILSFDDDRKRCLEILEFGGVTL